MKNRSDDYQGVVAQYYDLQYAPEDVAFYVDELAKAAAVLDVGCGTGRVLLPLLQAGHSVTGLDLSADMLARARTKIARLDPQAQARAELLQADMRSFRLEKKFDAAIIAFRGLMHLVSPGDHRRALECVREHLVEDGLLVFDLAEPALDALATATQPAVPLLTGAEIINPATFRRVLVSHSQRAKLETQTFEEWMVFEEINDDGEVVKKTCTPRTFRWFNRFEMEYLLELSGFRVESLYGDFDRNPWAAGGDQVWIARRV